MKSGDLRSQALLPNQPSLKRYGSVIRPVILEDIDGDGRRELVALLNTGYGRQPRAVACFDFDTTHLLALRHGALAGGCHGC